MKSVWTVGITTVAVLGMVVAWGALLGQGAGAAGDGAKGVAAAERRELAAAKEVALALDQKSTIVPTTPEYVELQRTWKKKVGILEIRLAGGKEARQKAAEDFLATAKSLRERIKARVNIDADHVSIMLGEGAVTEAETILERVKAGEEVGF